MDRGVLIDIPLTNQDLGTLSGSARETVNRLLNELKREGNLYIQKGKITIHNLAYFKKRDQL